MTYFTSYEKTLFLEPEVFFAGEQKTDLQSMDYLDRIPKRTISKNYYFKGVLLKELLLI